MQRLAQIERVNHPAHHRFVGDLLDDFGVQCKLSVVSPVKLGKVGHAVGLKIDQHKALSLCKEQVGNALYGDAVAANFGDYLRQVLRTKQIRARQSRKR